jgi:folate-binding protein YgfZ
MQDSGPNAAIISLLNGLTLISVTGEDAEVFLHAQLTADIRSLPVGQGTLAGWCDPKGRLLTILRVFRITDNNFLLALPDRLVPDVIPRLRLFVLRARVKIEEPHPRMRILGAVGADVGRLISESGPASVFDIGSVTGKITHALVSDDGLASIQSALKNLQWLPEADWNFIEIAAGLPQVVQATSGEFIPQMVNLDLTGGVSFNKGCYPGQEIVARLYFRGGLKSRMLRMSSTESGIKSGDPVFFPETFGDQVAGRVVTACDVKSGGSEMLVVAPLAARSGGNLFLRSPDSGLKLSLLELPYSIPDKS